VVYLRSGAQLGPLILSEVQLGLDDLLEAVQARTEFLQVDDFNSQHVYSWDCIGPRLILTGDLRSGLKPP
jgi:hypothetical protein